MNMIGNAQPTYSSSWLAFTGGSNLPRVSGSVGSSARTERFCWAGPVSFFTIFFYNFLEENKICKKVFRSKKSLDLKIVQI
jgi:hypothetical protein